MPLASHRDVQQDEHGLYITAHGYRLRPPTNSLAIKGERIRIHGCPDPAKAAFGQIAIRGRTERWTLPANTQPDLPLDKATNP